MRKIYTPLLAAVLLALSGTASGQALLGNSTYTQDFNTLDNQNTTSDLLPPGWLIRETGTSTAADGRYAVSTGSNNAGNSYSFGAAGSIDRALGGLISSSLTPVIGVAFTNNTGSTLTTLVVSYTGEQWRLGALNRPDRLEFQYSTDATSLETGSWTPVDALHFSAPATGPVVGLLDGNADANRRAISHTLTGLNIPAGATFYFRWTDFNASGSDDGLAIDDFQLSTSVVDAEAPQITGVQPGADATGVLPSLKPVLSFSEAIVAGSGGFVLTNTITGLEERIAANDPRIVVAGTTLTLNLRLRPNSSYRLLVESGAVADAAGNLFAGAYTWSFATGDQQLVFNFDDCSGAALSGGFTRYSVSGLQTWNCSNFGINRSGAIGISGFASGSGRDNEDWLITPAFDLEGFNFPVLSFATLGEFNGPALKLMVSTNYDGVSNPKDPAFTWTELNGYFGETGVWTNTTGLNMSRYKQASVHFAFVYTASPADGAARWTIDNFQLENAAVAPAPVVLFGPKELDLDYVKAGAASPSQQLTYTAYNLVADLTLTAPAGFQLSPDGNTYSHVLTIARETAEGSKGSVYVRFAPDAADKEFSGTITLSSGDLRIQATALAGTSLRALKVVNWNIEWFGHLQNGPSNNDLQQQNVQQVLNRLNADVYALVEVVDTLRLKAVVDAMPGYAYTIGDFGSYTDGVSDPDYPTAQKLAFVYRTGVVKQLSSYGMLRQGGSAEAFNNWASGRYPYLMQAEVNLEGVTTTVHFALLHAKANTGDQVASWQRRKGGADELKDSLDAQYPFANIVMVGDFNDDLDVTIASGIPGNESSYSSFLQDPVDYKPITLPLSLAGQRSTASYDNVIDHQMTSNEMGVAYVPASARVLSGITSWITNYANTTSDHFPVVARYDVRYFKNPIAYKGFTGTVNGSRVIFKWTTDHEINSSRFVLERSRDGVLYFPVDSLPGLGSSREGKAYQLEHGTVWPGKTHYRLRVNGLDGSVRYSAVQIINMKALSAALSVSAPTTSQVQARYSAAAEAAATIQLLDLNGKLYHQEQTRFVRGQNIRMLPTGNLPAGVYLVRIVQGNTVATEKIYIRK